MAFQQSSVLLASVILASVMYAANACNENTFEVDITNCLKDLDTLTDPKQGPVTEARIDQYCASKSDQDISCAENLINSCRDISERARRIFERTIDIGAVRRAVNIVCNNSAVVSEQQACIGKYQDGVTTCLNTAERKHDAKLRALQARAQTEGVEWFEERAYESLCEYTNDMNVCHRPFGDNCGRRVGDLFDALVVAVTPPVCATLMGAAGAVAINLLLLVSTMFLALLKTTPY